MLCAWNTFLNPLKYPEGPFLPPLRHPLLYHTSSQVMELKNKCDAIEKRETEKRQLEEKKHQEELQSLKKTNQQLKVGGAHSPNHLAFS